MNLIFVRSETSGSEFEMDTQFVDSLQLIPSTILAGPECVDESLDAVPAHSTLVPSDEDKPGPISEDAILISLPVLESVDSELNRAYMVKYLKFNVSPNYNCY